jgi:hypothetical protein
MAQGIYASVNKTVSWSNLTDIPTAIVYMAQTDIDFGVIPIIEKKFTILNSSITSNSIIIAQIAYVTTEGKSLDEMEIDSFDLKCGSFNGGFYLYARSIEGLVSGIFKVNYSFST